MTGEEEEMFSGNHKIITFDLASIKIDEPEYEEPSDAPWWIGGALVVLFASALFLGFCAS